jgi:predicted ATP-grasp superfamily ATP-dependent carboligase
VNGIDFVLRGSAAYAIEVNPRWCASMELVERAYGISVFAAHAAACADGVLPAFDLQGARQSGRVWGKAIVFAQATCVMGDTRQWLDDPALRDVPHPGDGIDEGQPICTVLADAEDGLACEAALVARARHVYSGVSALADARVFSP